ncbi:MAG: alpha/beta fold hydrolase [Alcanivoracaceae bacterium]|nr:alpha/beta fold hydrolase [Alcanivoracaceae bacterium]
MKILRPTKAMMWGVAASLAFPMMAAHAAPVMGPSGESFYQPPVMAGGAHGDLIWYRNAAANLGANAPAVQAWNVMYHSTDALDASNIVTGTVLVPSTPWSGAGNRPVVSYAVGTHGLAQHCAPSRQIAAGTDYENANIAAALRAGYTVLVTDNPGYTTGKVPTYLAGKAQGHAALDIVAAAAQIPSAGISTNAPTAVWGYSQGGQTAAWAGEMLGSYSSNLNVVGIAAGGTPADFVETAYYLDGSAGSSFLLQAVVGLGEQYPQGIPVDDLANNLGKATIDQVVANDCVFDALFPYMNTSISKYTVGNKSLQQLLQISSVSDTLSAQQLGNKKVSVPIYMYHGQADEFIPLDQHTDLKGKYCRKFTNATFATYPSEHIVTQFQAAPYVLSWLGDRFANKNTAGTCLTFNKKPSSTANPGGGNFVVSLDEWPLDATIKLKTLGQDVVLPEGSAFTADTDMTAGTLDGTLAVPEFLAKLNILLPLDVKLSVVPVGRTTGSASLDNNGQLSVHGDALADITIKSAGFGWLQIPFGCKTETAVEFPVNFDGPISSLGNGNFTFGGETTFPSMKSCGLFNGMFTLLMSGPGQKYSFNIAPPAPKAW